MLLRLSWYSVFAVYVVGNELGYRLSKNEELEGILFLYFALYSSPMQDGIVNEVTGQKPPPHYTSFLGSNLNGHGTQINLKSL